MKKGWQTAKLGEVCPIASRKPEPFTGKRRYFSTGAVGPEGELSEPEFVDFDNRPSRAGSMPLVGDVGFARMKGTRKVIRIDDSLKGSLFSTGFCFIAPRPAVDPRFAFYFVMSDYFQKTKDSRAGDGIMGGIKNSDAAAIEMALPSVAEQQRIVKLLDEALAGLAAAQTHAKRNYLNARAIFESHLHSVFTLRGKGWVESNIGAEVRFIDYRGRTPVKTGSGIRLITAKNVKMGYLQESPMEFIAADSYESWMTRGIPKKGDVLFTTEAPLANVAQLDTDEKVAFAQRIIIMQPHAESLDSTFLKYLLLSQPVQNRIHAKGTGATVKGIKASLLKTIDISFPKSLAEQKKVAATLGTLAEETQRLASLYERKQAALESLKHSLLHQAITGNL